MTKFTRILLIILISSEVKTKENYVVQVEDFIDNYENQQCMCVPFWQCKGDYSGFNDDGSGIIDIRGPHGKAQYNKIFSKGEFGPRQKTCSGEFDVCCQVECGKRRSLRSDTMEYRILGEGNEAEFAEFPWMLGILEDRRYRCGASLIHPQVALTAAHCVTGRGPFKIRAGEWNWAENTEPLPHQDRTPKKIIMHPQYHAASLRNDIALLILNSPFDLSENVGIACLPIQRIQVDSNRCVATGWGKNSHKRGSYQTTLKKIELPIVQKDHCLRTLREVRLGPRFELHKSFICAGGEANKDTCKGDGGSPLICPVVDQSEKYVQLGIVSWGLTCGLQDTPGVYVNVDLFRSWIDEVMKAQNFDVNAYKY